jgi:hypothetical protein
MESRRFASSRMLLAYGGRLRLCCARRPYSTAGEDGGGSPMGGGLGSLVEEGLEGAGSGPDGTGS